MAFSRLQAAQLGLPDDPSRPVCFALSRAFLENFNEVLSATAEATLAAKHKRKNEVESEILRILKSAGTYVENCRELMHWVYLSSAPLSFEQVIANVRQMSQLGAEADDVKEIFIGLQKCPVGRPHKRQSYIRAFEFQLQSKQNTQGQATRKFCPCGAKIHTTKCEQNLKAGMRSVKKVLRKYAPELVSRYEVLHPDRARKVNG